MRARVPRGKGSLWRSTAGWPGAGGTFAEDAAPRCPPVASCACPELAALSPGSQGSRQQAVRSQHRFSATAKSKIVLRVITGHLISDKPLMGGRGWRYSASPGRAGGDSDVIL